MIKGFNGEYRFLSNFWASQIEFEGIEYPTVEHAYQAAKTESPVHRQTIANLPSASGAKSAGRTLAIRPDWDDIKLAVMKRLLDKKFREPLLRSALLQTGQEELCEGNYWHDNFWGSCECSRCGNAGENHLGKLLMEVRSGLLIGATT